MDARVREQVLGDLKGLIQIPSLSRDPVNVETALDYFLAVAGKMGFHTEKLLDGQIGIVEMGPAADAECLDFGQPGGACPACETLGILVHLDVVDVGNPSDWDCPPFDLTIKDGMIYGRGVLDDKGPAMAALHAMKAVSDRGHALHKKVRMIIGTQEEVEWTDMDAYTARYPLPDYSFTPDGVFPIGNVEKGNYDITMEFPYGDEEHMVDFNHPSIIAMECGTACNVVPALCSVVLSDCRILHAEGLAAHTCLPDKGVNALFVMKEKLDREVRLHENTCSRVMNMLCEYFSDFTGEKLGLMRKEAYYQGEFIHKNLFTPSIVRTTADGVEVVINGRFAYTTSPQEIRDAFERLCAEYGGRIVAEDCMPAVFVSRNTPFIKQLAGAYEAVTGTLADFTISYGATYCKALPNTVSFGPKFPDMEVTNHQKNEHMPLEKFEQMYDILEAAIAGIVLSEESMKPAVE